MKKLFMFLALSGLVTLGVSCSSDDNSSDEVKEGQLAVTADKTEIKEGDSVKFTITLDGKADTSAELFIEDTQIYTPHKFDKAGKYNVVAKKKGAKTSAPVTITVSEKDGGTDPVEKTLTLKADNVSVKVGGTVTFTVTDGTAAVADPVIRIVDGEAIKGATWTATKAGEFKFVASKEGFKDSKEVLVIVEEPATEGENNYVKIGDKVYNILGADLGVVTNESRNAILFSLNDGRKYLQYQLFANLNEEGTDVAIIYLAVIMPEGASQILYPQDVDINNVLLMDALVGLDNKVAARIAEDDDTVSLIMNWGAKPTETTLGEVKYDFDSKAFDVKYDGEYEGLYAVPYQGNSTNSTKSFKGNSHKKFDKLETLNVKLVK